MKHLELIQINELEHPNKLAFMQGYSCLTPEMRLDQTTQYRVILNCQETHDLYALYTLSYTNDDGYFFFELPRYFGCTAYGSCSGLDKIPEIGTVFTTDYELSKLPDDSLIPEGTIIRPHSYCCILKENGDCYCGYDDEPTTMCVEMKRLPITRITT